MHRTEVEAILLSESIEMQQTGDIRRRDHLGLRTSMVGETVEAHSTGHRLFDDGEYPPETATFVAPAEIHQFQPVDRSQQLPRGIDSFGFSSFAGCSESQFPQSMAARMQANAIGEPGHWLHGRAVLDEELAEFPGTSGHFLRTGARNEERELSSDRRRAAARERNDFVETIEHIDVVLTQRLRTAHLARCQEGLTATCLVFWIDRLEPQGIKYVEGSQADLGSQLIDVAGNKESDTHLMGLRSVGVAHLQGSPDNIPYSVEHMSGERRGVAAGLSRRAAPPPSRDILLVV